MALLGVASVNAVLALVVWRAARREQNRVFALVALSVGLWTLANALFRSAATTGEATVWAQVAYGGALSTAATFLHFTWVYPPPAHLSGQGQAVGKSQFSSVRYAGLYSAVLYGAAALIAGLTLVPGLVIRGIDLEAGRILTGPGLYLVAGFMLAALTLALIRLLRSQSHLESRARDQARYVLYGSALSAALGLFFNLILPLQGDYSWVWLGPLCSLFLVGFSAYSIVAHHLFDVRLLIRRTLVYTLLLSVLAGVFTLLERGLEHLLLPFLGEGGGFSFDLVAALVVGFAVDPLKRRLHHLVESRLFRDESARATQPRVRT